MKLISFALVTLAALVSPACGSVSNERSGESGSAPLPEIAQVICEPSETRLLTPEVRPQADGVHLNVQNNSTREIAFVVDDPGSGGGGFDVPGGAVMDLYPGRVRVARYDASRDDPSEMVGEQLEIIDEDGTWVSPSLGPSCKIASTSVGDGVAEIGEPGDTIALARGSSRITGCGRTTPSSRRGTPSRRRALSGLCAMARRSRPSPIGATARAAGSRTK